MIKEWVLDEKVSVHPHGSLKVFKTIPDSHTKRLMVSGGTLDSGMGEKVTPEEELFALQLEQPYSSTFAYFLFKPDNRFGAVARSAYEFQLFVEGKSLACVLHFEQGGDDPDYGFLTKRDWLEKIDKLPFLISLGVLTNDQDNGEPYAYLVTRREPLGHYLPVSELVVAYDAIRDYLPTRFQSPLSASELERLNQPIFKLVKEHHNETNEGKAPSRLLEIADTWLSGIPMRYWPLYFKD